MSSNSLDKVWWVWLGFMGLLLAIMLVGQGHQQSPQMLDDGSTIRTLVKQ